MIELRDDQANLLRTPTRKVVMFGAAWCGPCQKLKPIFRSFADGVSSPCYSVDIDNAPQIASRFGVQTVPTVVVLDGANEISRATGLLSAQRLRRMLSGDV